MSTVGTLSVIGKVFNEERLNRTVAYLAKTAIKEVLGEEGQELEDIES